VKLTAGNLRLLPRPLARVAEVDALVAEEIRDEAFVRRVFDVTDIRALDRTPAPTEGDAS
jgi:hypothetical protein